MSTDFLFGVFIQVEKNIGARRVKSKCFTLQTIYRLAPYTALVS